MKTITLVLILLSLNTFSQDIEVRNDIVIAKVSSNINVEECITKLTTGVCYLNFNSNVNIVKEFKRKLHSIIDSKNGCTVEATLRVNRMIVLARSKGKVSALDCLSYYKETIENYKVSTLFYISQ